MNSSRTPKRRTGRQLAIGVVTAGILSVGLAVPAYAVNINAITVAPAFINLANQGAVVISGTADPAVTTVTLGLDDGTAASIFDIATNLVAGSWTATVPASALSDGNVTIIAGFDPLACDPTVTGAICSASSTAVKDTLAPEPPTVFPLSGATFTGPTNIDIVSLDPADSTYVRFGPAPVGDPVPGSAGTTLMTGSQFMVSSTGQVKAIAVDPAGNTSTVMPAADFTVTIPAPAPTATPTTTTLAISPASPQVDGTVVTLTASVSTTPASPAAVGTFEFFDNGTSLGAPGAATKTVTPTVGTHSYTVKFMPTNAANFTTSTSTASAFTITATPVVVTPPPAGGGTPPAGGGTPPAASPPAASPPAASPPAASPPAANPPASNPPAANPPAAVVTAPRVISRSPAANRTGVSRTANIKVKFNKNVTGVNARSFTLRTSTGRAVPAVVSYNRTTHVATLNPTRTLAAGTRYTVRLTSAIKAAAGKPLTPSRWSFTTARASVTTTSSVATLNALHVRMGFS